MSGILCHNRVPLHIKENIYKVVVRPALLNINTTNNQIPGEESKHIRDENAKVDERNQKKG